VLVICSNEDKNFFSRFAPRARASVVLVICPNEDKKFFALRASLCSSSARMRTKIFFRASRLVPAPPLCSSSAKRARAFAAQTLLMEYAFFFALRHCFSFAFAFFQIRADQK
jgi:hypothetical protein